jgi:hypothetical protein
MAMIDLPRSRVCRLYLTVANWVTFPPPKKVLSAVWKQMCN